MILPLSGHCFALGRHAYGSGVAAPGIGDGPRGRHCSASVGYAKLPGRVRPGPRSCGRHAVGPECRAPAVGGEIRVVDRTTSGAGRPPSCVGSLDARRSTGMLALADDEALLWDAEHHLAAAEWRIICQLEHLEQMRRDGASTAAAEAVLDALRRGRDAWDARRSELLGRVYPAGSLTSAA